MADIVDSLRKHQKMIILGAALGIIALYVLPVDQLVNALTVHERIHNAIANAISHISANTHIPSDVKARILAHLADVEYKVTSHLPPGL